MQTQLKNLVRKELVNFQTVKILQAGMSPEVRDPKEKKV